MCVAKLTLRVVCGRVLDVCGRGALIGGRCAASFAYLLSALTCVLDWLSMRRRNEGTVYGQLYMRRRASGCVALLQHVDWYFWSNGLFLVGIIGDMSDTLSDYFNPDSEGSRVVALCAVIAWIVSAVVDLGRFVRLRWVRSTLPCSSPTQICNVQNKKFAPFL